MKSCPVVYTVHPQGIILACFHASVVLDRGYCQSVFTFFPSSVRERHVVKLFPQFTLAFIGIYKPLNSGGDF